MVRLLERVKGLVVKDYSLYRSLAKWISITIIICSAGEFLISQQISSRIDSLTLEREGRLILGEYKSGLSDRWTQEASRQPLASEPMRSRLERLLGEMFTSSNLIPVVKYGSELILPPTASRELRTERLEHIVRELETDDDQYIVNLAGRAPALAVASTQLSLRGIQGDRTRLMLLMRWPLLQSLHELQWQALRLKGITLIAVILSSSLLLYFLLSPLRSLNSKTKKLTADNLSEGKLEVRNAPKEIKELIISYNQAISRLDREYENQRQFASSVSHEFKTPLTVIFGFIDSVLLRDELSERSRRKLLTAQKETHRLNKLVTNLLNLSRYSSPIKSFHNKPFSPRKVLEDLSDLLAEASHNRVIIENTGVSGSLLCSGDEGCYFQIVNNLCENALKYSAPDQPVVVRLSDRVSHILTEVIDKGPGVPESEQERIFDRFYRSDGHRKLTDKPSSGLGLSVVKVMAESMNASVGVDSTLGAGSIFWLKTDKMSPVCESIHE